MLKSLLLISALPAATQAANIFAPGNQVFGVRSDGTSFLIATSGGDGGATVYTDNNWPGVNPDNPPTTFNEGPAHAIDGIGQKYLNFAELNTGIMVSPGSSSVVTSISIWTANDAPGRDPATYSVYGTNQPLNAAGMPLSAFTLISTGAITLPATRNAGGTAVLDPLNLGTASFANTTAYANYAIIFPTVKDEPTVNSMQIAEVQLTGTLVPEPGSALLAGLGGLVLARRRRESVIGGSS
jgi:hypothetical protein